nr:hypothetical protein [Desulfobacula sp.]
MKNDEERSGKKFYATSGKDSESGQPVSRFLFNGGQIDRNPGENIEDFETRAMKEAGFENYDTLFIYGAACLIANGAKS